MNDAVQSVVPYTNWNATKEFGAARQLVDDALECEERHDSLLVDALIRSARLAEEWRGEHRAEIDAYLRDLAPELAKDGTVKRPADPELAIVKCIFHRLSKQQHTWRSNALRQAFKDGRTADDLAVYFKEKPPTTRAKQWRNDHRKAPKRPKLEVAIPGKLALPKDMTIPPEGKTVQLFEKDGRFSLAIPQPRGRRPAGQPDQPAA
jgi:hypothetical protein